MAYRSTSTKPSSASPSNLPFTYRARKSLGEIISDEPVDPGSVAQTFIDIANSLADIHARRWAHGPLTPATHRFNEQGHPVPMRYYWKFCHATGRSLPTSPVWDPHYAERPDNPILNVSWTDAYAFAEWAGKWLPSMPEWKVASTTAGHLLDFHVFETAPLGVRSYSWVDASSWDPLAQSGLAVRRYVDGKVSVPVPVSDLDGTDAIPFRCAASSEILQTSHFLGSTDPSRTGSLR